MEIVNPVVLGSVRARQERLNGIGETVLPITVHGDSAIAGFLIAFLKGETIEMCLKCACMCGAQNVQVLDAVSGVKKWEQTTREIKSGWNKNELIINISIYNY